MTEHSPLQLAAEALTNIFGFPNMVRKDIGCFNVAFPSPLLGEERAYEMHVEWTPSAQELLLQLGLHFDLSPLKQNKKYLGVLEKNTEPFLKKYYEGSGMLQFDDDPRGSFIPYYEAVIEYAPLEDGEIEPQFRASLLRGLYMLELLAPTFAQIEQGHTPNSYEQMQSMMIIFGLWELNVLSENNAHIRLPPGLYEGNNPSMRN